MNKRKKLLLLSQLLFASIYGVLLLPSWYFYSLKQSMHKVLRSFNWSELLFGDFFWQLVYYAVVILALHLLCGLLLWWLFDRVSKAVPKIEQSYLSLGSLWLLTGVEFIFLANQLSFPQSIFSILEFNTFGLWSAKAFLLLYASLVVGFCLVVLVDLALKSSWRRLGGVAVPLLIIAFTVSDFNLRQAVATDTVPSGKPNVILIGVDSLRLDQINDTVTPSINSFLDNALQFPQAYTPQGRTYVAWMSILTGRYPLHHGARYNLIDESELKPQPLLSRTLQQAGYETVYAIDERLYSNLGEEDGFDRVIGPPTGAIDFMMVHYGDFPLTNLLSSTSFAKWVLPSLYGNRGAYNIYKPQVHSARIRNFLESRRSQQPLFLVAHFCLPHWPYLWSESRHVENGAENTVKHYQQALSAADQQAGTLLEDLKQHGYLNNAIVVVLSDHGETLPGEVVAYRKSDGSEQAVNRFGHGSSVLSMAQNQVLLAWKSFGPARKFATGQSPQPASLLDIAPTLQSLILPSERQNFDGESLLPWLKNARAAIKPRELYLETGFYLPSMERLVYDLNAVATTASKYYRINEAGKVRIKHKYLGKLLADKQRALLRVDEGKMVAFIPDPELGMTTVGINIETNRYYTEEELAKYPEYLAMRSNLCRFYSQDLAYLEKTACLANNL